MFVRGEPEDHHMPYARAGKIPSDTGTTWLSFPPVYLPDFPDDLYNRIELESLTFRGMKLHLQARQSEPFQASTSLLFCMWPIIANSVLKPQVAESLYGTSFVSHLPFHSTTSFHMMTITINIRWKLPTETFGSSTISNGYV